MLAFRVSCPSRFDLACNKLQSGADPQASGSAPFGSRGDRTPLLPCPPSTASSGWEDFRIVPWRQCHAFVVTPCLVLCPVIATILARLNDMHTKVNRLIESSKASPWVVALAAFVPCLYRVTTVALNTRRVQPALPTLPRRVWLCMAVTCHCRAKSRAIFVFITGLPRK